jgi:hypothetical protein
VESVWDEDYQAWWYLCYALDKDGYVWIGDNRPTEDDPPDNEPVLHTWDNSW